MGTTFKARQMIPGKDTISVMALHYDLTPSTVRDIIKSAGVEVIRADGFKGVLVTVKSATGKSRVVGWSDGQRGVDMATTKLTKPAIKTVALWKFNQGDESGSDSEA